MRWLGIDTGGTFTDFAYFDGKSLRMHKVLSTPAAPELAILQGIREMDIALDDLRVVHGTTVATNAVLEGKGARTVYIANRGLKDILTIGRQARAELYNLQPEPVPPPVPPELCLETGGRLSAQGEVVEDLTETGLADLRRQVQNIAPEAAAVNLLFSFLDNRFEKRIAAALPESVFVSLSSEVLPLLREYERGISTWLNAYVGPRMSGYLARLGTALNPARLSVMRSSGDTCLARQAGRETVHLLLSGPAGGLVGARYIGSAAGERRLISFDMGGTSTDVALIDGDIELTSEGQIGRYPVGVPMVDLHTIGAGGGSIAAVDAGGNLRVGPESAGAAPGPACYGRGGRRPTVTDANLILGRLPADALLGGSLRLDPGQALAVMQALAMDLGLDSAEAAAEGVVRIANEHMLQALRVISVQRGIDPRGFVLVAFGGAGGLHVCDLAQALDMRRALAPIHAGVLSALGMLAAPAGRQLTRSIARPLEALDDSGIESALAELAAQGQSALLEQGIAAQRIVQQASLDLCYRGQAYTLNIDWRGAAAAESDFHRAHEQRFGHRLDAPLELVNLRMSVRSPAEPPGLPGVDATAGPAEQYTAVYGCDEPVPVLRRASLPAGRVLSGPLIVCDAESTTFVATAWRCRRDPCGNLLLERG